MKRKYVLMGSLLAIASPLVMTGCDNDPAVNAPSYTTNPAAKPKPTITDRADVDNINRDTDVLSADHPSMANAKYTDISFDQGQSSLSDEAQQELDELQDEIDQETEVYLTVRVIDGDTIEATDPEPAVESLSEPRFKAIKEYLEGENVNISKAALDEAGVVANQGESNAMARPQMDEMKEDFQVVVVRIQER